MSMNEFRVTPCMGVLSNSDLSLRFVHRTPDRSRSEVRCTHGGQPNERWYWCRSANPRRADISARSSALFRFAAPFFAMGVLCLLYDPPVPPRQEQRIRIAYLGADNAEIARRIEQAGIPLFPVRQKLFDFFA